ADYAGRLGRPVPAEAQARREDWHVSSVEVQTPTAEVARLDPRLAAALRSEPVILLGMLGALGIYYLVPGLAAAVVGGALFFALAFGALGVLWVLVPDIPTSDLRKIALRDFRINVLEPVLFFGLIVRWLRTERDLWRMVGAWLIASALVGREAVEQYLFGQ